MACKTKCEITKILEDKIWGNFYNLGWKKTLYAENKNPIVGERTANMPTWKVSNSDHQMTWLIEKQIGTTSQGKRIRGKILRAEGHQVQYSSMGNAS